MELIKEYVFMILAASVTAGITTRLSEAKSGIDKYVKFAVSIVILSMLAVPMISSVRTISNAIENIPSVSQYGDNIKDGEGKGNAALSAYTDAVEKAIENLINDKYKVKVEVKAALKLDNGNISVDSISIYGKVNIDILLYIKSVFGCETRGFSEE